jgi:hypothetical protein
MGFGETKARKNDGTKERKSEENEKMRRRDVSRDMPRRVSVVGMK